jgi:hypothetical protein
MKYYTHTLIQKVNLAARSLSNPSESCLGKIKKVLSEERIYAIVGQNLKFAIAKAIKEISQNDLISFYRHTGYI